MTSHDGPGSRPPSDASENRRTFICHASEDHPVAETICASLESGGVPCWIAPRDVQAGGNYADSIVAAISHARALLLIYSHHAEASAHVRRELEQAVNNDVRIVPVRIEEVMPGPEVKYYLGSWQWLDAFPPPIDDHLARVAAAVRSPTPTRVRTRRKRWLPAAIAAALALVAIVVVGLLVGGGGGSDGDDEAQRIAACRDTHGLAKASTKRVLSQDGEDFRALFQACAWPPAPGADGDGFSEIAVVSGDGPGKSEAEGLTVRDVFTSECATLDARYLFFSQGKFTPEKPLRLAKGTIVRVEDGSVWTPRTEAEAEAFEPRRDEFAVLSNDRYSIDSVRCR